MFIWNTIFFTILVIIFYFSIFDLMNLEKTILENLRKSRESKNISQDNVAIHLNVTQSAYAKLEICKNKISLKKLIEVSEILEIDFLQLLFPKNIIPAHLTLETIGEYIEKLENDNRNLLKNNLEIKNKYIDLLEKNK